MSQQLLIVILLLLLIVAAAMALIFDARQRRIDRHVSIALSSAQTESIPSIRRTQVVSKWRLLHRLVDYRPGISYAFRPEYVVIVGALAAASTLYANTRLGFPLPIVCLAAVVEASTGHAGIVWMAAPSPRQSIVPPVARHRRNRDERRSLRTSCQ